jgi:hypothetical protein
MATVNPDKPMEQVNLDSLFMDSDVPKFMEIIASGVLVIYTKVAMNEATRHGQLIMLECWKNSGLKLIYSSMGLDGVSSNNHAYDTIKWWIESGLKLEYTDLTMNWLASEGNFPAIELWFNYCFWHSCLEYSSSSVESCCIMGNLKSLKWWLDKKISHEVEFKLGKGVDYAAENNRIDILNWLKAKANEGHFQFKFTEKAIDMESTCGSINALNWFVVNFPNNLIYTEKALEGALRCNRTSRNDSIE